MAETDYYEILGVGKTATAVNLSYLSARSGAASLLWDLDPQGAASFYFRARPKKKVKLKGMLRGRRDPRKAVRGTDFEGLDLLPADFSYRKMDQNLERAKRPVRQLARLLEPLSERELEVLRLAARGLANKAIADELSAVHQELGRDIIKAIDFAEALGRADTRLMGLIGKIKDAPQGYAGGGCWVVAAGFRAVRLGARFLAGRRERLRCSSRSASQAAILGAKSRWHLLLT